MSILKHNKTFLSIMACLFLIFCAFFVTRQYTVKAQDSMPQKSFSRMSQAGADYLSRLKGGLLTGDNPEPTHEGNAGGFLGYTGTLKTDNGTSVEGWFSPNTNADGSYDYQVLTGIYQNYFHLGYKLNKLGVDQTAGNGFDNSVRQAIGILVLSLFLLAQSVGVFWDIVLKVLTYANPFYLFSEALGQSLPSGNLSSPTGAIQQGMYELGKAVGSFYDTLQNLAIYTTLPLIIVTSLFIWLVVRKGQNFGSTFKGLIIRFVFTCIGIPLCFSCYTSTLSLIKDFSMFSTVDLCTAAISSTFVDFENWVYTHRLALADTSLVDVTTKELSADEISRVRKICFLVNRLSGRDDTGHYNPDVFGNLGDLISDTDSLTFDRTGLGRYDLSMLDLIETNESKSNEELITHVLDLLERYAHGDKISAGSFASHIRDLIDKTSYTTGYLGASGSSDVNEVMKMYAMSEDWEFFAPDYARSYSLTTGGLDIQMSADQVKQYAKDRFKHEGIYPEYNVWADGSGDISGTPYLSSMAMYNYLSTTFLSNRMIVYSSDDVTGNFSKAEHYSVNIVGSDMMQIVYICDLIVLLGLFVIVGYGYSFSILLGNIKAMFKIIPSALSGIVGSMRGIASVLILVAALIIEILGTCILYTLAIQFVSSVYKIVEVPLSLALSPLSDSVIIGQLGAVLMGLVSIVSLILIGKKLLQWRYAICQSITEATAGIINKFLGTNVGTPELGKPGATFGQKIGNAAMVAGGLALAAGSDGKDTASLGERLGLAGSSEDGEAGERGEESENTSSESYSNSDTTKGLGVKSDNGTGETPGKTENSSDTGYNGSDIDGRNINTESDAQKYVDENADFMQNNGGTSSGSTVNNSDTSSQVMDERDAASNPMVDNAAGSDTKTPFNSTTTATESVDANNEVSKLTSEDSNTEIDESSTKDSKIAANSDSSENIEETETSTKTKNVDTSSDSSTDIDVSGSNSGQSAYVVQGDDGQQYTMINPKTGQPYTAQDAANGEAYTLMNGKGQVYTDSSGNIYTNMTPGSVQVGTDGNIETISNSQGKLTAVTSADVQSGTVQADVTAQPGAIQGAASGSTGAYAGAAGGFVAGNVYAQAVQQSGGYGVPAGGASVNNTYNTTESNVTAGQPTVIGQTAGQVSTGDVTVNASGGNASSIVSQGSTGHTVETVNTSGGSSDRGSVAVDVHSTGSAGGDVTVNPVAVESGGSNGGSVVVTENGGQGAAISQNVVNQTDVTSNLISGNSGVAAAASGTSTVNVNENVYSTGYSDTVIENSSVMDNNIAVSDSNNNETGSDNDADNEEPGLVGMLRNTLGGVATAVAGEVKARAKSNKKPPDGSNK